MVKTYFFFSLCRRHPCRHAGWLRRHCSNKRCSQCIQLGEYMDTDLFDEFTEQTGIRVNYSTYESNEAMYTKLRSGSVNYDVIIPGLYDQPFD